MKAYERLLRYVRVYTTSDESSGTHPSAEREFTLADELRRELIAIGVTDAKTDSHCYTYGHIPASAGCENAPAIAFISHIDTAPDFCGEGVNPVITENYDGGDLPLGGSGRVLRVTDFPHLTRLAGRTLITNDGTTLLGADDKAGVAEIMTAAEKIIKEGLPHGKICICFTPDEEIGGGTDCIDLTALGADFGYTVDGGCEGEIAFENFNAASGKVELTGVNVHPGSAKDIMVNASLLAAEFISMLPKDRVPERTDGREGFFHLTHMTGSVESATLEYIIRDHDNKTFADMCDEFRAAGEKMAEKYGHDKVKVTVREQYRNMIEKITPCMHLVDVAREAAEAVGVIPFIEAVRGGTDGARLSFMGLPCPNLGTGGYAFHGPYEHITVEGMDKATGIILGIVAAYSKKTR